jgi:hypothetical protein
MPRVLSFGGGRQSTYVFIQSKLGAIQPFDLVLFADTGWEPKAIYEYIDYLQKRFGGIEIIKTSSIKEDVLGMAGERRFASMPFFVKNADGKPAMLRRQCTEEYKITPIKNRIKEAFAPTAKNPVELAICISLDEIHRAKDSRVKYIKNVFPLLDRRENILDVMSWFKNHPEIKTPTKSSCLGCPFHDLHYWRNMDKREFAEVVEFDKKIRQLPRIRGEVFLNRFLKPMDELLQESEQLEFFDECEGYCFV